MPGIYQGCGAIHGKGYVIVRPLVESTNSVFEARHENLPGAYVVRVFPADLSVEAAQRIRTGVRRSLLLRHPGIEQVMDFSVADEDPAFVVTEYLRGNSLDETMAKDGIISFPKAMELIAQIAAALEGAHGFGIVHGDLNPGAIRLVEGADGRLVTKLLGFGWSRELREAGHRGGERTYVAPEQQTPLASVDVDPRSDQFALAVIAYEMLGGCLPFSEESTDLSDPDARQARRRQPPPPLSEMVLDLPSALDQVLRRALSYEAHDRFPSLQAFAAALRSLALGGATGSADESSPTSPSAVAEVDPLASLPTPPPIAAAPPGANGASATIDVESATRIARETTRETVSVETRATDAAASEGVAREAVATEAAPLATALPLETTTDGAATDSPPPIALLDSLRPEAQAAQAPTSDSEVAAALALELDPEVRAAIDSLTPPPAASVPAEASPDEAALAAEATPDLRTSDGSDHDARGVLLAAEADDVAADSHADVSEGVAPAEQSPQALALSAGTAESSASTPPLEELGKDLLARIEQEANPPAAAAGQVSVAEANGVASPSAHGAAHGMVTSPPRVMLPPADLSPLPDIVSVSPLLARPKPPARTRVLFLAATVAVLIGAISVMARMGKQVPVIQVEAPLAAPPAHAKDAPRPLAAVKATAASVGAPIVPAVSAVPAVPAAPIIPVHGAQASAEPAPRAPTGAAGPMVVPSTSSAVAAAAPSSTTSERARASRGRSRRGASHRAVARRDRSER